MDPSRDNPLVRFAAFWWAIGVISLFGFFLIILWLVKGGDDDVNPLEEAAAIERYNIRAKVDAAQSANFEWKVVEEGATVQAPPDAVFALVGKQLLSSEPAPVKDPAQVIPGSEAAEALAAAPDSDFGAVDEMTAPAGTAPDPAAMEKGKQEFLLCMACHGLQGEGGVLGPPLAGSDWVSGPVSNLIRIQFRGLTGPITVSGKELIFPIPMEPVGAAKSDEDIAAVLTYVRNSFGNSAPPVSPEQVKALRGEIGKPKLTAADMINLGN